jgi:uncharacterized membrane protein
MGGETVFEGVLGLPLHPLAVHAAVVFVPLLVVASLAYALMPRWRSRVGWAVVLLAVLAPIFAVVARQSGTAFADRLTLPVEGDLANHQNYGTITMWITIALGVLALGLVWAGRAGGAAAGKAWLTGALTVLVVGAALAAGVYVFLTGDLGSRIVWEETWQNTE